MNDFHRVRCVPLRTVGGKPDAQTASLKRKPLSTQDWEADAMSRARDRQDNFTGCGKLMAG
jgi:hypothetical protein